MILKIYFFFFIYQDFNSTFIRCGNSQGQAGVSGTNLGRNLTYLYPIMEDSTERTERGSLTQILNKNRLFQKQKPGKNSFFNKSRLILDLFSAYRREKHGNKKQGKDCEESRPGYICMENLQQTPEIQSNQLTTEITNKLWCRKRRIVKC